MLVLGLELARKLQLRSFVQEKKTVIINYALLTSNDRKSCIIKNRPLTEAILLVEQVLMFVGRQAFVLQK